MSAAVADRHKHDHLRHEDKKDMAWHRILGNIFKRYYQAFPEGWRTDPPNVIQRPWNVPTSAPPPTSENTTNTTTRTLFSKPQGNQDDVSAIMTGPNPCDRVDFRLPDDPKGRQYCLDYEALSYVHPICQGHGINQTVHVPKIYHSVGPGMQKYHQVATTLTNPEYRRNHHDDDSALVYIEKYCGAEAAAAYSCITPPAYRADIFRFCALYAEGGIYLDEDILPAVPLDEMYSPCAVATLGHDSPQNGHPGKQMKILAGQPGAPIFKCALERSVENIQNRRYPHRGPLALTGPLLLHDCYEMHSDNVAVVYHDSRNAKWPYTGMRAGIKILAVELPLNAKYFDEAGTESDPGDYNDLFMARRIYRKTCVSDDFIFPSIDERIEYYMGSWLHGAIMDRTPYMCGDVHWFNDIEKKYHTAQVRVSDGQQWMTYGPNLYELEGLDASSVHYYLSDAKQYLASAWHGGKLRFLMHFGDTVNYYDLPVVVKARPSGEWKEGLRYPIIAPLEIWRHFDPIALVTEQDMTWHDKKESLVWRGVSSGSRANTIDQIFDRFYPEYADIGITELVQGDEKVEKFKRLLKPALTMKEQLAFKYILSLEGNDVASGLKWQLYSNSVVFMPHPSRVSWAMEDQLLPYYHYIPLEDDLSDIYEKLEWARKNDALCQRIAQHATEYIDHLWVGEKSQHDTKRILEGMVGKYQGLFGESLEQCSSFSEEQSTGKSH